jgi:tetratricopeptide (TPR) repeat protein
MARYFIERARRQFAARDLPAALESCARAVAEDASSAEAWFLKGTLEMALGQSVQAVASAARATQAAPRDAKAWYLLGNAHGDRSREAAREAYARAVELAPDWSVALNRLGTVLIEMGDLAGAESALTRAVQADPAHARSWNNLAHARIERGRWDEAEQALLQALRIQPDYETAFANIARVARARGDEPRAAEYATVAERLRQLPTGRDS